jgi:hypothetical protein
MKVYISVDMEGISGLVRWPDVAPAGIDFQRNRRLMTADANAAIEGAFDAGATEVVVEENHGVEDLCVLLMDEPAPYEFEVELREPICEDMRNNLESLEKFEVEGEQLVRIIAEDMDLGFRRVAYLGFANLPGVTRY